jgi:hypothetical protein
MAYSALNPVIWLIFGAFVAVTYVAVKVYHKKYPHYPDMKKRK